MTPAEIAALRACDVGELVARCREYLEDDDLALQDVCEMAQTLTNALVGLVAERDEWKDVATEAITSRGLASSRASKAEAQRNDLLVQRGQVELDLTASRALLAEAAKTIREHLATLPQCEDCKERPAVLTMANGRGKCDACFVPPEPGWQTLLRVRNPTVRALAALLAKLKEASHG